MTTRITLPDRYRIDGLLGRGTASSVYRAYDQHEERAIALKVLDPAGWMDAAESSARLRRTADALAPLTCLRHPSLASVYGIETVGSTLFIARELVDGVSLDEITGRRAILPYSDVANIVTAVADALDALGGMGYHHGALTPHNIFLRPDGTVKVTDAAYSEAALRFDLAGIACRLPRELAPCDDVAALAAISCRLLTGAWPLHRDGTVSSAYTVPPSVRRGIDRALREGSRRYPCATAFAGLFATKAVRRPTIVRWRPVAAAGLFASLATLNGSAYPAQTGRAPRARAVHPVLRPVSIPLTLSEDDRQLVRLAIRRQGPAALARPAIEEAFRITPQQRTEIGDILGSQRNHVEEIVNAAIGRTPGDTSEALRSLRETTRMRILSVLDADQRALWESLTKTPTTPDEPVL